MNQWIRVDEEQPKEGYYIVWVRSEIDFPKSNGGWRSVYYHEAIDKWAVFGNDRVTHYLNIEPPKE